MGSFYSSFLIPLHSILAVALIALFIASIISALSKMKTPAISSLSKKYFLGTFIFSHIQLVLGLVLYFISPKVSHSSGFMKNEVLRFFALEHPLMMIISIVLITIGYIRAKRVDFPNRYIFWFYLPAFLILLSRIPYKYLTFIGA